MMASRRWYDFAKRRMKLMTRRKLPKTTRLSWLREARGKTNVERAEKRVRMTTIDPDRKARTWRIGI